MQKILKIETQQLPTLQEGQLLIQTLYLSVDPYLRGRMRGIKTYVDPFVVGNPLESNGAAKVIESKNSKFQKDDIVCGVIPWAEYAVLAEKGLMKYDTSSKISLESRLSAAGLTGLTAYFGLIDIGQPKAGETVLVSGAAGATGIIVGQIAKIYGCKVIGIVGSDDKAEYIKKELGFDAAINYKTCGNMVQTIGNAAPEKIDIFFDNVGGEIFDAAIINMKNFW